MNLLVQPVLEQAAPVLPQPDVMRAVEAVLSLPEEELDYARAKVALDALVDPGADAEWTFAELAKLAKAARRIAGSGASAARKVEALRIHHLPERTLERFPSVRL